ncbi:MAG: hypothetical protein A2066_00125 [Bacteroidetes bacterium GWB2_41_8]|nr:MAG: hypothetical protein A2066_00125 [Bacteroidetes bacterium GWB2_41_8]
MLKNPIQPQPPQKPKVLIDFPVLLEAFCRYLFKTPDHQQEIYAPRSHSIGRAVNGYLSKSDFKPVLPKPENPVIFIVPETKYNWYSLQTKYLYFSSEDREAFIDRVETIFSNWAEIHFKEGYAMNLDQFAIVESVLDILNVRMNATNFDAIKKHDYRERKTEVRKRSKAILMQRKLAI